MIIEVDIDDVMRAVAAHMDAIKRIMPIGWEPSLILTDTSQETMSTCLSLLPIEQVHATLTEIMTNRETVHGRVNRDSCRMGDKLNPGGVQ